MATTKTKAPKKPKTVPASANGSHVSQTPTDVLTLTEAAAYLRVTEDDVVNMVLTQDLAGRQIGTQWRFLKTSVEDWLRSPPRTPGNEALLAMAGIWKDDPYVDEMLKEIYKQRGRPMTEGEE